MENNSADNKILSVDIGGSHIKATLLSQSGELLMDYKKLPTPMPATPQNVIGTMKELLKSFEGYSKISIGFPGYVKDGVIKTAPNLNTDFWKDFNLTLEIEHTFNTPVRVVNDADLLGLGVISGKGLEMVVTLGTGFGTALVYNGVLLPHFEIAHHPISKGDDYDVYIGEQALQDKGLEKWNERMQKVIRILITVFNYDTLYIGGGNAKRLNFKLDENIRIFSNKEGIKGGARLWQSGAEVGKF